MQDNHRQLIQERTELNTMINRGVSFDVQDVEVKCKTKLFGLLKKKTVVPIKRKFTIEEPTLATLDRISSECIEMTIDEDALDKEDGMTQANTMVCNHALRCAKIIAIAVLGSDYLIPKIGKGGAVTYVKDDVSLEELTLLFARRIKPSELYQIYVLIIAMCNLGDFMNSIRLMSAIRTTAPVRIEESIVD